MAEQTGKISIADKEAYQASIKTLQTLQAQIQGKLDAFSTVMDAVKKEASAGVVDLGSAGTAQGTLAPAYHTTISILGTKTFENVSAHVTAAQSSIANSITSLQNVYNAITTADETGKQSVEKN